MRAGVDTWRHKGMRSRLVEGLKVKGITDEAVLEAINAIPRHFFLDTAFDNIAYEDRAFPIGLGQTISQPYTVAYQTQLLEVRPFDRILEVGTGSGYQAAVLSKMKARVFTIERQKKLFDVLKNSVFKKKYPFVKRFYGDGYKGLPTYAPFDKIIVTAAAPLIPKALLEQLKPEGVMVIPVGGREGQRMFRIIKGEGGEYEQEFFDNFSFVPMLKDKTN